MTLLFLLACAPEELPFSSAPEACALLSDATGEPDSIPMACTNSWASADDCPNVEVKQVSFHEAQMLCNSCEQASGACLMDISECSGDSTSTENVLTLNCVQIARR